MIRHWDSFSTPDIDTESEYDLDAARERQARYTHGIVDASGYDQREFVDWLHEQDGHNCDRDWLLRFIETPHKWQPEWERFIKEMESK